MARQQPDRDAVVERLVEDWVQISVLGEPGAELDARRAGASQALSRLLHTPGIDNVGDPYPDQGNPDLRVARSIAGQLLQVVGLGSVVRTVISPERLI